MSVSTERGWPLATARLLGEALFCSAAMALPFLVLGGAFAGIIAAVVAIFWRNIASLAWRLSGRDQPLDDPDSEKQPETFFFSGMMAASGLAAIVYVAMMRWAYAPVAVASQLESILKPGLWIPVPLILLAAGSLAYQLFKRHRAGESLQAAIPEIRQGWLDAFGGVGSFLALTVVFVASLAFYNIADMVAVDRTPAAWEIFSNYPILIPAILLSAIFAVSAPHGHDSGKYRRMGTAIRIAGFPVALAIALYGCIHIAVVAATTSVPAFVSATVAGTEAFKWVVEQQENGVAPADIAAGLNDHGRPDLLRPEDGLAVLLPNFRDLLENRVPRRDCNIALHAAVADPAELIGMAWPEDLNSHGDPEAPREIIGVKYCVKVTCPSIVVGDDRPMSAIFTSHPTTNPGWLYTLRFQLFYPDEELNAGGYCTKEGELAAEYQG